MKKLTTLLVLLLSAMVLSGCGKVRECEEYKTERYYNSMGTTLRIIHKNPAFLVQNGYEERKVCIKYKDLTPTPNQDD